MAETAMEELTMDPDNQSGTEVIYINENALILDGDDEVQYVIPSHMTGAGGLLVREDGVQLAHYLVPDSLAELEDKGHIIIQQAGYAELQDDTNEQGQAIEGEQHVFQIADDEELGEVTQVVLNEEQCRMLQGCGRVLLQEGTRRFILDGDGLREVDPSDAQELQNMQYVMPSDENGEEVTLVPYSEYDVMAQEFETGEAVCEENENNIKAEKSNIPTDIQDIMEHCAIEMEVDNDQQTHETQSSLHGNKKQIIYIANDHDIESSNIKNDNESEMQYEVTEITTKEKNPNNIMESDNQCSYGEVDGEQTYNHVDEAIFIKVEKKFPQKKNSLNDELLRNSDKTSATFNTSCDRSLDKKTNKIVMMPDFAKRSSDTPGPPHGKKKFFPPDFKINGTLQKNNRDMEKTATKIQKPFEPKINTKIYIGRTQDGKSLYGRIIDFKPSSASKVPLNAKSNTSLEKDNSSVVDNPSKDTSIMKESKNNTFVHNKRIVIENKDILLEDDRDSSGERKIEKDNKNDANDNVVISVARPTKKAIRRVKVVSKIKQKNETENIPKSDKVELTKTITDVDRLMKVIKCENGDLESIHTNDSKSIGKITPKANRPLILNRCIQLNEKSNVPTLSTELTPSNCTNFRLDQLNLDQELQGISNNSIKRTKPRKQNCEAAAKVEIRLLENMEVTPEQGLLSLTTQNQLLSLTSVLSTLMKVPNLAAPLSTRDLLVVKEESDKEKIFIGRMLNLDQEGPEDWHFIFMPELSRNYSGEDSDKESVLKTGNFLMIKLGKNSGANATEVVIMDKVRSSDTSYRLWDNNSSSSAKSKNARKNCPVCKKKFYRTSNLNRHLTIHNVQETAEGERTEGHACSSCSCVFRFSSTLTRHILEYHTDKTNVQTQP